MKTLVLLSTWAFLASGAISSARASSAYTCTTFTQGPASFTYFTGINNNGQVVGIWYNDSPEGQPRGALHAFLRNVDGTTTTLASPTGSDDFIPAGINNHGQILGQGSKGAFILNPDGSYTNIAPAVAPPGEAYLSTEFGGINDKGELTGIIDSEPNPDRPDPGHVELAFIRGADRIYRMIDRLVVDSGPSLPGPINNSEFVVEHTGHSEDFLLRPNAPKLPLLFPGMNTDSGNVASTGLNNNNITASSINNLPPENVFAFLRASDGHYPAIVCPDPPNTEPFVTGVNDRNVVVGGIWPKSPGPGIEAVGFIATPTGVSPHAQLSHTSWTFSSHVTGETSGLGRVFLSNTGPADLHIPTLYVGTTGQSSDHVSSFQITQTNCGKPEAFSGQMEPGIIPPGASCFVEFRFTPQVRGWQTAAIYIPDDSPKSPEAIEVGGTGFGGTLRLSNTSWTFAAHRVGETSRNGVIYAYNAGPGNVTFTKNTQIVDAVQPSSFHLISDTCGSPNYAPSTLPPYTTCSVTFNFAPSAPGEQMATLHLNDDSISGPIQIPLSGYAIGPRSYTITDLGTLGGTSAWPAAINDKGEVVGWSLTNKGESHPVLWQNGKIIDLSTFTAGGYRPSAAPPAALGINNKGQVVGSSDNGVAQHAFLWQDGQMTDLGTLGGNSIAYAINNNGQVVGASDSSSGEHAFLWVAGKMTDLGTLPRGALSSANAINDNGQIAGFSTTDGVLHEAPALWQDGKIVHIMGLGGDYGLASGINNKGQVVGDSTIKAVFGFSPLHAFLWQDGRIQDLSYGDIDESNAHGINDAGQIIGTASHIVNPGDSHTVLWENGIVTDLNKLVPAEFGSVQGIGASINNRGQIVLSVTRQGQNRVIILTP